MSSDKGYIESAVDKTKEMAGEVKEKVGEAWDRLTGKTEEQKWADSAKEKIDTTAEKAHDMRESANEKWDEMKERATDVQDSCSRRANEMRESAADQMRDAARTVEGH